MRKAERGRKMTASGKLFLEEFSGRVKRSPMVTNYWRRRQKQERLKRKLERRKQAAIAGKSGGDITTTMGGDDQQQEIPQDQYQTGGGDNIDNVDDVVQEYDA